MDIKVFYILAGVLLLTLSIGFAAGVLVTCKIIKFGVRTSYEIKNGTGFIDKQPPSPEVDMLNDKDKKNET